MHYKRERRLGSVDLPNAEDRFWALVDKSEDHWWWRGARGRSGHGTFSGGKEYSGKTMGAHRWAVYFVTGKMPPEGMVVDHLCHEASCVNPAHLRVATYTENAQNRRGPDSRNALGIRGVEVIRGKSKTQFRARGKFDGEIRYFGTYETPEEAARAASDARRSAWSVPGHLPVEG